MTAHPKPGQDIFDRIWRRESPALELYRGFGLLALLDPRPTTLGDILIISEHCVPAWHNLSPREWQRMTALGQIMAQRQLEVFGDAQQSSTPYDAAASAFGDEVRHPHLRISPKYARGDVIGRLHPGSGRMQAPVDVPALVAAHRQLEFFPPQVAAIDQALGAI